MVFGEPLVEREEDTDRCKVDLDRRTLYMNCDLE